MSMINANELLHFFCRPTVTQLGLLDVLKAFSADRHLSISFCISFCDLESDNVIANKCFCRRDNRWELPKIDTE